MTIEQASTLSGHLAWPIVALISLIVLRPHISQLLRSAADLRDVLNRSGEMVDLVGQISALNQATSDIKVMQELAQAARPPVATASLETAEQLWRQIEKQWQDTRDSFRAVAQSAGVPVSFIGTIGVRNAAKALTDKNVINDETAAAMTDLSAQYQYMFRTGDRSQFLNDNVVVAYAKAATRVRQLLKSSS